MLSKNYSVNFFIILIALFNNLTHLFRKTQLELSAPFKKNGLLLSKSFKRLSFFEQAK